MNKVISIFILLFLLGLELFSQTITVIEKKSAKPIDNVAIYNQKRNISTLTTIEGKADISIFSSSDSLCFQHTGYEPITLSKEFIKNENYIISLEIKSIILDEFVVSGSKLKESKRNVAYSIDIIDAKDISIVSSKTSAEILLETGNIVVQKTQGGGGSPIIRGFEANKILLVVDGVRMNNAIYRSGHLQNSITIDNSILEKTEIIYGPSSVMYGSDALGGVINYITKEPILSKTDKIRNFGSANFSLNSPTGLKGHFNYNFGGKKIASLFSFTYNSFNDIEIGRNRINYENDFGKCFHFVKNINGIDSTFVNSNPNILIGTAYNQYDILQKNLFLPFKNLTLVSNIQYSTSSKINRYDKLNDYEGENLKYAEYYYGPQKRLLTSLKANYKNDNKLFTEFTSILSFQRIDEDRISRKFGNENRLIQEEDVSIFSGNFDFVKKHSKQNMINYGFEINYNFLSSNAIYSNIYNDSIINAQTRYPDGGSFVQNYSSYLRYKFYLDESNIFSAGMRLSLAKLQSDFLDTNFIKLPFQSINIFTGAPTGSFSFIHRFSNDFQINTIFSTGYRIPNVDDYGKIREKNALVTIPNDKLKPEYAYNFELGLIKKFNEKYELQAVVYNTYLTNAIVRSFYSVNGMDSIIYDGELCRVITNLNADKAKIFGLSLSFKAQLSKRFYFKTNANYTNGKILTDSVNQALGHIPPFFTQSNIIYRYKKFDSQLSFVYHAWKRIEDFSLYGEDNEAEATELGFPPWYIVNFKLSYEFFENGRINFAANNIFDQYYKVFASGVSSSGRNFMISLNLSF